MNHRTMQDSQDVLSNVYDTLLQLRYPDITRAGPKNVEATILTGESRVALLAWLLTEKSIYVYTALQKLQGKALEDELFKLYSEMGICTNKNVLLGKCTLKEQLPTLRLLIEFMKNVHTSSNTPTCDNQQSVDNILKAYLNEDKEILSMCNIKPKLSYSEAMQYFEDIKSELKEAEEVDDSTETSKDVTNPAEVPNEEKDKESSSETTDMFSTERENFTTAFEGLDTWETANTNQKHTRSSMDEDIKSAYSNFAKLREILQIQDEISKANIPKELNVANTPLNGVVEEAVVYIDKFRNTCVDDYDDY